jgi:hypothetical protein
VLGGKVGEYGKYYNENTEEAFSAKVAKIHEITIKRSGIRYIAIEIERDVDGTTQTVYLGPK